VPADFSGSTGGDCHADGEAGCGGQFGSVSPLRGASLVLPQSILPHHYGMMEKSSFDGSVSYWSGRRDLNSRPPVPQIQINFSLTLLSYRSRCCTHVITHCNRQRAHPNSRDFTKSRVVRSAGWSAPSAAESHGRSRWPAPANGATCAGMLRRSRRHSLCCPGRRSGSAGFSLPRRDASIGRLFWAFGGAR
jgi:hypothetical protein